MPETDPKIFTGHDGRKYRIIFVKGSPMFKEEIK